jgi:DNA invertase Pin-like site-specific DNA recombinase
MKAAIYARKSTKKLGQKETIENQIKICKRYAQDNGLEIVDIKTDAATGTDDINRPEIKELIADAVNGKYDCVIMKGISRLYRDTEKGLGLIKKLDRSGVRVITVEEMFDSQEHRTSTNKLDLSRITMYLMFSEMESKKLADRIKYTQIEKAHAGEWNQASSVPFGYSYNSATKKLDIDHADAPIVKTIFDLYTSGMGMKSIAQHLNGDAQPSPRSKRWSEYTVGFILKNEVYIGNIVYNKRSKTERPYKQPELIGKTSDDVYVGNDYNEREKWIITENAHPAIIDDKTFAKVQEMMQTKAKRKGIRNNVSLFAGIAVCGKCGSGMTFKRGRKNSAGHVVTKDNYYCMNYIRYGKQFCTSHHVGAHELETVILDDLTELVNNKAKLNALFHQHKSKLPASTNNYEKEKNEIGKEITKVTILMEKLLEKNMMGDVDDRQYKLMNAKYSERLNALSDALEEIEIKMLATDDSEDKTEKFKTDIKEIVNYHTKTIEEKRYDLLNLIEKVIVYENAEIDVHYKFEDTEIQ